MFFSGFESRKLVIYPFTSVFEKQSVCAHTFSVLQHIFYILLFYKVLIMRIVFFDCRFKEIAFACAHTLCFCS